MEPIMLTAENCRDYGAAYVWFSGRNTYLNENIKVVGFSKVFLKSRLTSERKLLIWCAFRYPSYVPQLCVDAFAQAELTKIGDPNYRSHSSWSDELSMEDDSLEILGGQPGVWQSIQPVGPENPGEARMLRVHWHPVPVNYNSLCTVGKKLAYDMLTSHPDCTHFVKERYFCLPRTQSSGLNTVPEKSMFTFYKDLVNYIVNFHSIDDFFNFSPTFFHLPTPSQEFAQQLCLQDAWIQFGLQSSRELLCIDMEKDGFLNFDVFSNYSPREVYEIAKNLSEALPTISQDEIMQLNAENVPRPLSEIAVDAQEQSVRDNAERGIEIIVIDE